MKKNEYDNLPVSACKWCNSLYLIVDPEGNDVCGRCHSKNEIIIFDTIEDWEERNRIDESV